MRILGAFAKANIHSHMPNIATGLYEEYNANCDGCPWCFCFAFLRSEDHLYHLALLGRLVNISKSCRTLVCSVSLSFHPLPGHSSYGYIQPSFPPIILPFLRLLLFYRCGGIHTKAPAHFYIYIYVFYFLVSVLPFCAPPFIYFAHGFAANWELFLCMNCVKKLVIIC